VTILYELQLQTKSIAKLNNQIDSPFSISEARINPIYKEKTTKKIADHFLQTNEM